MKKTPYTDFSLRLLKLEQEARELQLFATARRINDAVREAGYEIADRIARNEYRRNNK